jgi:hypothetical protein
MACPQAVFRIYETASNKTRFRIIATRLTRLRGREKEFMQRLVRIQRAH